MKSKTQRQVRIHSKVDEMLNELVELINEDSIPPVSRQSIVARLIIRSHEQHFLKKSNK